MHGQDAASRRKLSTLVNRAGWTCAILLGVWELPEWEEHAKEARGRAASSGMSQKDGCLANMMGHKRAGARSSTYVPHYVAHGVGGFSLRT